MSEPGGCGGSDRETAGAAGGAAGRWRAAAAVLLPYLGLGVCYAATVLGGLTLADEVAAAGLVAFEDPGDVGNVGVFGALVVGFTAILVAAFRYDRGEELVRLLVLASFGVLVADGLALAGIGGVVTDRSLLFGLPGTPLSAAVAALTTAALWAYPEWYVVDAAAIAAGAVAIPMLGLGFGPLPVVVLLVLWAGYDAYAVYGSGHMKDLAAGLGSLRAPLLFVVPTERGFSYRRGDPEDLDVGEDAGGGTGEDGEREADGASERPAVMLGLGDAIIPGMLAVSAGNFVDAPTLVPALNANAPAVGALIGGVVGVAALFAVVHRTEGVHAGLPPLNAGVLGGYLLGAVAAGVPIASALGLG